MNPTDRPSNSFSPYSEITRRSFMKKTALTAGAITILGQGIGFAETLTACSSGIHPNTPGKCTGTTDPKGPYKRAASYVGNTYQLVTCTCLGGGTQRRYQLIDDNSDPKLEFKEIPTDMDQHTTESGGHAMH